MSIDDRNSKCHRSQCPDIHFSVRMLEQESSFQGRSFARHSARDNMERERTTLPTFARAGDRKKSTAWTGRLQTLGLADLWLSENSPATLTLAAANSKKFFPAINEPLVDTTGKLFRITATVLSCQRPLRKHWQHHRRHQPPMPYHSQLELFFTEQNFKSLRNYREIINILLLSSLDRVTVTKFCIAQTIIVLNVFPSRD